MEGPTHVDLLTRVVSGNDVTSPISGLRAAFVHVEVLERLPDDDWALGEVIFGDLVTLEVEGAVAHVGMRVEIVARRAELTLTSLRRLALPMQQIPSELVPWLSRARSGGAICHREHLVLQGDRLRLRAAVERTESGRLVVRDDLVPVRLDGI